ncbi:MAG: M20/M25/M40 family metallo-hydrolase [Chloroflexota bacterium]
MSQMVEAWLEIIERILGHFIVVDGAAPDWLRDAETDSQLWVDRLYPELGIALRFKGLAGRAESGAVAFMPESERDALYERLCRRAGVSLLTICFQTDDPAAALAALRGALSAAGRRVAQRPVAAEAKRELLPRIAAAKANCQQIAGALASTTDLTSFAQAWQGRAAAVKEPSPPLAVQPSPAQPTRPQSAAQPAPARVAPVQASERIDVVDILRGFALFGVLAFNMSGFAGHGLDFQRYSGVIDRATMLFIRFLIQAKFYTLFSFLFGWGMSVQMSRAQARGGRFLSLYVRRLIVLLVLGVLHGILFWQGDILTAYALLGFLLLLFRKRSPRVVLAAAVLALAFRFALVVPGEALDAVRNGWANLTAFMRSSTYPESVYASGNFLEVSRLRLQDFLGSLSWLLYYGDVFAMFLLGLYVGKREIFQQIERHLPLVRAVMWLGLVIGVLLNGVFVSTIVWPAWAPREYGTLVAVGSRTLGAPALMLFYVTAIVLLSRRETWRRRLAPLANVGRSALSNYLLQSLICSLLFAGYGLGLYGQVGPAWGLLLTVILYSLQIRLSAWWFDRYQFGPMEWLWRTLSYRRRQPLLLGETSDDLRPWWPRRLASRLSPALTLALVWLLLLAWAGGLVLWQNRLAGSDAQVDLAPLFAQATQSAAAEAGATATDSQGQVAAVATPVVETVAYRPGPIVTSGDLLALAATFDAGQALAQLQTLTGPPFLGRYAGSPQGWAAGDYIAARFAEYGLQPAGDDGAFFQSFPLELVTLAALPSLVIEGPDGARYDDYVLHRDFSAIVRGYAAAGSASGPVVWANNCTHADLDSLDVMDKIVLCRDGSIYETTRNVLEHGAAGLLLLTDPEHHPPDFGNVYFENWVPEPIPVLRVFPSLVDELLLGSGKTVADLSIHFDAFPLMTRVHMNVTTAGRETCPVAGCQGRNVLGVIPGRDPAYADQVIILGAHYDHLGQAPDGTIWPGANDNASGVAVLLEIARSWQEQGYVPRHTVLFAAWDAEEMGLLGSGHYVAHPRYPLDETVAKIQLDMVGDGADVLYVDGKGELAVLLHAIARSLGIETQITDTGGSDHVPFRRAGVPASLLIWFEGLESAPHYHRPSDTPEVIEPHKLDTVGQIVTLAVLSLSEGEPAIDDLVARRAAAVAEGDLAAFLATSLPEQQTVDRFWFADAQSFSPTAFEMTASEVQVTGRAATARVSMALSYLSDGQTKQEKASLEGRFVYTEVGWRWAGPNLVGVEREAGFALAHPPEKTQGLQGLGQQAADRYAQMASTLGLPAEVEATLLLFPTSQALWESTGLSLPVRGDTWVDRGVIKLVYSSTISDSTHLDGALLQLAMAEAGVIESAAPWLWQGLPLAWQAQADAVAAQQQYLPQLQAALEAEKPLSDEVAAWAAVDYLQRQVGWLGLGQLIEAVGQACDQGMCGDGAGLDAALSAVFTTDAAGLQAAWQADWRARLAAAQAGLDALLTARSAAVLTGDQAAFLRTVDPEAPHLLAEEQSWFAGLVNRPLQSFELTGSPRAFLNDGSLLASVQLRYRLAGGSHTQSGVTLTVRFTPAGDGYRWAGLPFERAQAGGVTLLYPQVEHELALALLQQAASDYAALAAELGVPRPQALTIKLFASDDAFRTSLSPAVARSDWLQAWTAQGESIRLRPRPSASAEDYRATLAVQMARHLLHQMGVRSEWLLRGASLYLARRVDGGLGEQAAAQSLADLLRAVQSRQSGSLITLPAGLELSEEAARLADAQAWDSVRYLVYTHGRSALTTLLQADAQGLDADAALRRTVGQSLADFEAAWAESLAVGHTLPEWVEVANAFDPERAFEHVDWLSRPELAGRQAGSSGAALAADYIAARFAEYGLQPAGDPSPAGSVEHTFLQRFPISYTTLLAAPRLEIVDAAGGALVELVFREQFLLLLAGAGGQGGITGELVWVRDDHYQGLNLDGKIALRRRDRETDVEAEIERAVEHGAGALILIGNVENKKEALVKTPLSAAFVSEAAIPVLELTQDGYSHLLEIMGYAPPDLQNSPPALPLGVRVYVEIPLGLPQTVHTANVLGLLPGSDPVLSQEVIILGAHYDHVGDDPDGRRYSGANDNASGVAVLLEMARLWHEMGYRPRHSVLFAAWEAQELGMWGSKYYLAHPVFALDKTRAVLQLDAVGGGSGHYMEAQGLRQREGLWLFILEVAEDLVDGRLKLTVPTELTDPSQVVGGNDDFYRAPWEALASGLTQARVSDNVTFLRAGIPSLLVTWRGASEDNWPDELAYDVQPLRLGVTGRMVTLAAMALAR